MTDPKPEGDPAEFLLSTTKYHDCVLTVGNPAVEQVERIGVSSTHLIAHSTVFRDMLADSQLADPSGSNTHIVDISPSTFKLMLRHVYGCELPKITPEEATDLAICADKYNIQHLVKLAVKQIRPTSAEDVFPALLCVSYIICPDLGFQVSTIIQQQTDKIVKSPNFVQLDENCLLFIVKQNILNISELELWKSLVRWGENQVKEFPEKTLRNCLNKVLHHVRLLALTSDEILKHVLPTNILTPDEFIDLSVAVSRTKTLQSPNLCGLTKKRGIYRGDSSNAVGKQVQTFNTEYCIDSNPGYGVNGGICVLNALDSRSFSTLTIKPSVNMEISSFTVKSLQSNPMNSSSFNPVDILSNIYVYESSEGVLKSRDIITLKLTAVPNEDVTLQIKKVNGESLILEANKTYNLKFQMVPPLPVYRIYEGRNYDVTTSLFTYRHFTLKFEDSFHVLKTKYRVKVSEHPLIFILRMSVIIWFLI